jgi:hypothetical protein
MKVRLVLLLLPAFMLCSICSTPAQMPGEEVKTGTLLKREEIDGVDNVTDIPKIPISIS